MLATALKIAEAGGPSDAKLNKHTAATARPTWRPAFNSWSFRSISLVLCIATNEPQIPISHSTKPEAAGIATCIQGYPARLGFGITLTKNQHSDSNPNNGNRSLALFHPRLDKIRFPVWVRSPNDLPKAAFFFIFPTIY
jgi:hypothetical protein